MIKYILTLLVLFIHTFAVAVTYYVSPTTGNNSNSGTSVQQAWRTLSRIQSAPLQSGDVILLQAGSIHRGSISVNTSGVTISKYGDGFNPIIRGSIQLQSWVNVNGNVWSTSVAQPVTHLFCQGNLMTIARYPNQGWLRNKVGSGTSITDPDLQRPSGYWVGATAVIRTSGWSYDAVSITAHNSNTINFNPFLYGYNLENYKWGYFMQNKLEELDAENEWFYDPQSGILYFYPPQNSDPNNLLIEASISQKAISLGWATSNVNINQIQFEHFSDVAIETANANNIQVSNCMFNYVGTSIRHYGRNSVFSDNNISNTFKVGLWSLAGPDGGLANTIQNNILTNCAIFPGLGENSWGYFGINITGVNSVVRNNRLTNIGYIGIVFDNNALIERNVINRACFTLNDGGAIAFDNTNGAIIQDNIIYNVIGNTESCAPDYNGCDPKGKGIYFGNTSNKNVIVRRNTVSNCKGAGIWVDNTMVATNNQIIDNTLFNNDLYQLGFSDYSNTTGPLAAPPYAISQYNHTIQGNIMYSLQADQLSMYHINGWFTGVDFGDFNNNKYINPWNPNNIQIWYILTSTTTNYTLPQWQALRNDDPNSTTGPYNLLNAGPVENHRLFYNDNNSSQNINIPNGIWFDLDGNQISNSIQLEPFRSKILVKQSSPVALNPSTNASLLLQATAAPNPPSITLNWSSYASATEYSVFRKTKVAATWGNAIATLPSSTNTFTDLAISPGTYYEYRVVRNSSVGTAYGYTAAAVDLLPTEYRGKIILVIDNTLTNSLEQEINNLHHDLEADGWSPSIITVSPNDNSSAVKNQILSLYNSDPSGFKSVLLLGKIPVYRSANIAPDGHDFIPWACDSYYGDMNGSWSSPPSTLPSDLELEVGRIDMSGLPSFNQNEVDLIRAYLTKLTSFKRASFIPQKRSLIQNNFDGFRFAENGYRTAGNLTGINSITTLPTYTTPQFWSQVQQGYLWTYSCGGGSYNSADGIGNTSLYANNPHNGIFNMTFGSYFGNWSSSLPVPSWNNNTNNLLKAVIASGQALTNVWAGQPSWFFHHMGLGDNIGYSTRLSVNNRTANALYLPQNTGWLSDGYTTIHLGLLGDPTLRQSYIKPPQNLVVTSNNNQTTFSWEASSDQVEGYHIYKLQPNGSHLRLNQTVITTTTYTHPINSNTDDRFMVRALKLVNSFSGTYYDLSLGSISSIQLPSIPSLNINGVFLQGPYNSTLDLMTDSLRVKSLIPPTNPYPGLQLQPIQFEETQLISTPLLSIQGGLAIVDWILIELRNINNPSEILYSKAVLLRRNGTLIEPNGSNNINFNIISGVYHVLIKHRNHLPIVCLNINIQTNSNLDIQTTILSQGSPTITNANRKLMIAGDYSKDNIIKYTGNNNDRDRIILATGGVTPTNVLSGYYLEDGNMDGWVKYTGARNDRDLILFNIGGIVPTNTIIFSFP